jgi:hypothetical protein
MKKPYILECPFCGLKHSIDIDGDKTLLSSPEKIFALQCACDFSDRGCKNTIVIMSQETMKLISKK